MKLFIYVVIFFSSCTYTNVEKKIEGTWLGVTNSKGLVYVFAGKKCVVHNQKNDFSDTLSVLYKTDSTFQFTGLPWSGKEESLGVDTDQRIIFLDEDSLVLFDPVWSREFRFKRRKN